MCQAVHHTDLSSSAGGISVSPWKDLCLFEVDANIIWQMLVVCQPNHQLCTQTHTHTHTHTRVRTHARWVRQKTGQIQYPECINLIS